MFIGYQAGASYALLMGSFISDRESLIVLGPLLNLPLMMLSGFFADLKSVVPILWPFQWISSFKYLLNIMLTNEFTDNKKIKVVHMGPNGTPEYMTSNDLLSLAGVDMTLELSFMALIILYVAFLGFALLGLMYTIRKV